MRAFDIFLIASVLLVLHVKHTLQADTRECYYEGLFCESCSSVVRCIHNSDDTYTKSAQGNCNSGQKCLNGTCTTQAEPICDGTADVDFPCQTVGIYPHPFYCNQFVLCVVADIFGNLKAFVNECEYGYGFNIATDECDVKLEGNQCTELEYPVPVCEILGQSAALEERPSMYYTCQEVSSGLFSKVLYPILNKCPHGETFGEDFTCQEVSESTTTSASSDSSDSSDSTTSATTTT